MGDIAGGCAAVAVAVAVAVASTTFATADAAGDFMAAEYTTAAQPLAIGGPMSKFASPKLSVIVCETFSRPQLHCSRETASRISQQTASSSSSLVRMLPVAKLTPMSDRNGAESPYSNLIGDNG